MTKPVTKSTQRNDDTPVSTEADTLLARLSQHRPTHFARPDIEVIDGVVRTTPSLEQQIAMLLAVGTTDPKLGEYLLAVLGGAVAADRSNPTKKEIFEPLAIAFEIGPQDQVEGLLVTQMVATHLQAMDTLGRLKRAKHLEAANSYSNQANKLLRTFTAQIDALKRYRSKASQTVRVERVSVNEGGQAIVGDVHAAGRG